MKLQLCFDFDGTLANSAPAILATFAQILEAEGIAAVVPLDESLIGPPLKPCPCGDTVGRSYLRIECGTVTGCGKGNRGTRKDPQESNDAQPQ